MKDFRLAKSEGEVICWIRQMLCIPWCMDIRVVIEHPENLTLSWWTSLSLLRRGKDFRLAKSESEVICWIRQMLCVPWCMDIRVVIEHPENLTLC